MEFRKDTSDSKPIKIRRYIVSELESSLILYSGASRDSAKIINDQMKSISDMIGLKRCIK